MVSFLDRAGSLARGLRRKPAAKRRRDEDRRLRLAIDQLETRVALAITTPLSIGGSLPVVTVGSFTDAPTGPGSIGDYVTVSIEGTRGTVIFNDGVGVPDGGTITRIDIVDASPDFQVTFNGVVRTSGTGTPAVIPYGSDGIIQIGQIFTSNVIRGINTVRGPLTNTAPTTGTPSPVGFTQTAGGSTLTLAGDWTGTFLTNTFVCATPEVVSSGTIGSPVFARVTGTPLFSGGFTTIVLDNTLPTNTTGGALTLAESVNPYFELTSFVGVNFSNRGLKDSGGIFVDRVVGGTTDYGPNTGIALSQGLLAYSSIMIRDELDAEIILGTVAGAAVDGRVFIESATTDSAVIVGRQSRKNSKNSRFELQGGPNEFGADVVFQTAFNQGIVNLGGAATGEFVFRGGVGAQAVLNAASWANVVVPNGQSFAGTINAAGTDNVPNAGDLTMAVTGNLGATARVNAGDDLSLSVLGSVLKGATIAAGGDTTLTVGQNFAGALTTGGDLSGSIGGNVSGGSLVASNALSLDIGGSVVNSSVLAYDQHTLDVGGSIRNSRFYTQSEDMSIDVTGNVTNSNFAIGYDYDLEVIVGGNMSGSSLVAGSGDLSVDVAGSVTKSELNSTSGDVTLDVGVDLLNSKIVTGDDVEMTVGRDALGNTVLGDDDLTIDIGRNWSGVAQSASSDIFLDVGGSVLKGSSFVSGEDTRIEVAGNFDANTTSRNLRFFVDGNVSKASRITAQRVTNWDQSAATNFGIGGRLDGVVNVVDFDAAPDTTTVTLIGGGAGQSARFYVGEFQTDNLVFNGNFRGNLRVLQDLVANLTFQGNVDRITVGGRVGSYVPGNTVTTTFVNILVTGRLLFMNTNSYFQADSSNGGTFWNVPNGLTPAATGQIVTGGYGQIVPTRPTTVAPPVGGLPQNYTAPDAPTSVTASVFPDANGNQIQITFAAPANDTLPILRTVYYQWSTDGTTWSNFTNVLQAPGSDILLPGTFSDGTYTIQVRATNAIGSSTPATSNQVTIAVP